MILPTEAAADVLRNPSIIVPQDADVFERIAAWNRAPSNTASATDPATDPATDQDSLRERIERANRPPRFRTSGPTVYPGPPEQSQPLIPTIITNTPPKEPPEGECLACGHIMPFAVWRPGRPGVGLCGPCRDTAMRLRGPCSDERGCLCTRHS